MIFAAGLGKRLHPYTDSTAKGLVKVADVPMLERVLLKLRDFGVTDVVVNIHHFASQIKHFIEENNGFGLNVYLSDESERLLDTGGGLLAARRFLETDDDTPIIIHNTDILTDVPLDIMLGTHIESGALATLLCRERMSARQLYFDKDDMRLKGWADSRDPDAVIPPDFNPSDKSVKPLAFGGVHVVSQSIFGALEKYRNNVVRDNVFSITPFYASTCHINDIRAFEPHLDYMWFDIGSPEKLSEAEAAYINKELK